MGQAESKESEQNTGEAPQDVRRNTVHGNERTRRPTPPIASVISSRTTETKRTPATPGAPSPRRSANTPQTFPRSRGLTSVRPRMTPSSASQRQAATAVRTSGRLQQQFAIRPVKTATAMPSASSPAIAAPSRSQPIPISRPSTRSRRERPPQIRGRPTVRRSTPLTGASVQSTDSDQEPTGPPAKRITRSRIALSAAERAAAAAAAAPAASTAASVATAGPSTTRKRPRAERRSEDEPVRIGDIEPESADAGDKMSTSSESGDSEDESEDTASRSSDTSDPNELDQDLELDGSDEDDDERSDVSGGSGGGGRPSRRPADGTSPFQLRRSRRRSVPVRHLQVDPHRVSYVSV